MLTDEFESEVRRALTREVERLEIGPVRDRLVRHDYRVHRGRSRLMIGLAAGVVVLGGLATVLTLTTGAPPTRSAVLQPAMSPGTHLGLGLVDDQVRLVSAGTLWAVANVTSISCTDAQHCEAVGSGIHGGGAVSAATADGGAHWVVQELPPGLDRLSSLWCVSDSACIAVGSGPTGAALVSSDNGGNAWAEQPLPVAASHTSLVSVSCTSAISCWAVGELGSGAVLLHGSVAGGWSAIPPPAGLVALSAVGCDSVASAPVCLAVGTGAGGVPVTMVGGGGVWSEIPAPSGALALASAACTGPAASCTTLAEMGDYWVETQSFQGDGAGAGSRKWLMATLSDFIPGTVEGATSVCIAVGDPPCTPPNAPVVDTVSNVIASLGTGAGNPGLGGQALSSAYFSSAPGLVHKQLSPVWYMGVADQGLIANPVLTPAQRLGTASPGGAP